MINIFIIDDHQMVIEGIHSLLKDETNICWMGAAKTPGELMAFLKKQQPDIILMDIHLPQVSGLELCKQVKELYPGVDVIGVSTSSEASVIKKMLANGASGYLLKDVSRHELVTALQTVAAGKDYVSYSVSEVLKNRLPDVSLPALTRREKEILELIADGMTNPQIAAKLFLDVTTIDSHRKNMLTKFGVRNTAALVKIAVVNNLI